jgi:hypothetical protein
VLGGRIERNLYDLLETLIQAKYTRQRQPLLERANLMLEILRFQRRLTKDLQCLKAERYCFAAKAIDEIGKQAAGSREERIYAVRKMAALMSLLIFSRAKATFLRTPLSRSHIACRSAGTAALASAPTFPRASAAA